MLGRGMRFRILSGTLSCAAMTLVPHLMISSQRMITPKKKRVTRRQKPMSLINVMKISVVVWTAGLLTAYYAKILPQMDATFIAGLLTSTLGSLGVDIMKKDDDKSPPTPPTPTIPTRTPKP